MKKLLLGLGAITAVVVPVVSVISCGSTKDDSAKDLETTRTVYTASLKQLTSLTQAQKDNFEVELKVATSLDEFKTILGKAKAAQDKIIADKAAADKAAAEKSKATQTSDDDFAIKKSTLKSAVETAITQIEGSDTFKSFLTSDQLKDLGTISTKIAAATDIANLTALYDQAKQILDIAQLGSILFMANPNS